MQKYLVTGGAGFIGCHLVEKLIKSAKEVLVFDNLSFGRIENLQDLLNKIEFVKGDLDDRDLLQKTVNEFLPDIVIHLAAIHFIPYCNAHPREAVYVNVDGTHALLDICFRYRPRKILFASTAAVYPPSDRPHSEGDEMRPFDIYGATKICGETLMRLFAEQTSIPAVSCRLFNVYGPKETNDHVIPHIMDELKAGKTAIQLGNVSPKRDYVYVDDMVDALLAISTSNTDTYETFNIGTGVEYSVEELIRKISLILKKDITIQSVSKLRRKKDRPHLYSDITKIKTMIGWSPKYDIDRGLAALTNASNL